MQGLTQAEEMLICTVMPIMSIYRLPHGQYGYRGHVINLPQYVSAFATSLLRLTSELDIVLVRKEGAESSHHDFRVRKLVVLRALLWLGISDHTSACLHNQVQNHIAEIISLLAPFHAKMSMPWLASE